MTGARKVKPKPHTPQHARDLMAIRQLRHWTQLDLANALNVSRETISRWERGEKEPHPAWMKLVKVLLVNANAAEPIRPNGPADHEERCYLAGYGEDDAL